MGLFSSLVGIFKASDAPKEEEEASDCCVNGQCTCGESSFTEDEGNTVPIAVNTTTTTATSSISDDVANITISTSGNVKPSPITEAAPIEKLRPAIKNEVTMETQVEKSSREQKPVQLELDMPDIVETEAPAPVVAVTAPSSSSKVSSRSKTRKSKAKRGKKKKK